MFVSAATVLKFHSFQDETSTLTYEPLRIGNISSLSLSKDNGFMTFIIENERPEIISLKDPDNIKNVHTISSINGTSAIAFKRTTKRIIGLGTNSGQVALYDTKTKSISKLFQSTPCGINLLDFNAGDKQMAVSGVNGSILLYDTNRSDISETYFLSNSCCATTMRFHPKEGHLLMVGTEDGTLIQWDIDAGQHKFTIQAHTAPITGLVSVKNSNFLASVGYDHKFSICDVRMGKSAFRSNMQHPLTAIDGSSDGLNITIGALFGNVYTYDIRNLILPFKVEKPHDSRINQILFQHKPKDDFIEAIPDADTESYDAHPKEQSKFKNQITLDIRETFPSENMCKSSPNLKNENKAAVAKSVKEKVADAIYKSAEEVRSNLMNQLGSLQAFVVNEFRTIEAEMDEKWDFQNLSAIISEATTSKITPE